jgi:hypothetical protein
LAYASFAGVGESVGAVGSSWKGRNM